jgi:hypothetical protein
LKLELREEYTAEENTLHHDHEINNPHYDNLSDAFSIISNASTVVSCHEDQIFLSENFEDVEQIDRSTSNSFRSAEDDEGSVQLSHLQTHENCSKYEEKSEELKDSDQQFILYIPSSDLEQSVFSIKTRKGDGEQKELDQQVMMHVFLSDVEQPTLYEFQDPIAIWMDSRSSLMSYITEFGIMVCSSKHEPVAVLLWYFLFSFPVLCCIHKDGSGNLLLELFFWKFVYT